MQSCSPAEGEKNLTWLVDCDEVVGRRASSDSSPLLPKEKKIRVGCNDCALEVGDEAHMSTSTMLLSSRGQCA